jgi:hypothetical protein
LSPTGSWCCVAAFFISRSAPTIRKHREDILAAGRLKLSNARAEGLNNKVKLIVRRAYGFHSAPPSRSFTSPADRSHSHSHTNDRSRDFTYDHARRATNGRRRRRRVRACGRTRESPGSGCPDVADRDLLAGSEPAIREVGRYKGVVRTGAGQLGQAPAPRDMVGMVVSVEDVVIRRSCSRDLEIYMDVPAGFDDDGLAAASDRVGPQPRSLSSTCRTKNTRILRKLNYIG